jgi:hypothetical protein
LNRLRYLRVTVLLLKCTNCVMFKFVTSRKHIRWSSMSELRTMVLNLFLQGSSTVQLLATGWQYTPVLLLVSKQGYLVLGVQYNSCTTIRSRQYCRVRVLVHCTIVGNTSHTMMFESDKTTT